MIAAIQPPVVAQKESTCYHESGHAVVGILMGGTVHGLSIAQKDTPHGVQYGTCTWTRSSYIKGTIASLLAGPMAAWERNYRRGEMLSYGSRGDIRDAEEYLRSLYEQEGSTLEKLQDAGEFDDAMRIAQWTVAENWGAIHHIAQWLLTHDSMSGELAHAIVDAHKLKTKGRDNDE